ncbi:rhomboid family intramembrane serine protease [Silanimonas lenta]|uniref:rhomboid family intramembrane serine protease n=1 Tax=Silanimonas lenta TaxID=265429 RepID=UPI00049087F1|nr:rhomboid family intramembrane serine protease [Silanimonas lenta]
MLVDAPGRRRRRRRWATPLILLLCVGAFLGLATVDAATREALIVRWGALSAEAGDWHVLLQPDRAAGLITTLGLHGNGTHLVGNMLFLLVFGLPAERALGPWRLLLLFMLGGAVSNFVAALSLDRPDRVIIGASGAVSTLIGAYLALFPNARLGVVLPLGLWLQFVRMPAVVLITLWVVMQLLFTFAGPSFGAVAWWAHLSGFAFGFLAALLLREGLARRSRLHG